MAAISDLNLYLDTVVGATEGYLHTAIGVGPHLDDSGKFRHRRWIENQYRWPEQRSQVVADLLSAADDGDAYLCPYPMVSTKRAKGAAAARTKAHADVDGGLLDIEKASTLGAAAVASGSPGNGQVFVMLSESVPAHHHEALCRGLRDYLGAIDAKVSDNDVLRPPGTFNHKAAAAGGEPTPVRWLLRPETVWDPHELADHPLRIGLSVDATIDTRSTSDAN